MRKLIATLVTLMVVVLVLTMSSVAQEPAECGSDYTVQAGDWLSKIADELYGDYTLYPAIVLATNALSVSDDSYATIADPWLIIPDSKLCIPSVETAQSGLTAGVLKNAEYSSGWTGSKKAPLTGGEYREQAAPGSATHVVVMLSDRMAFGTSDTGQDMAAVILITDPGGSGTFYDLAVVIQQDAKALHVATASLGDRVRINSLSVEDGEIVVDMVTQGPDDPFCCPTQQVVQRYALQENELVQRSSEVIAAATHLEDTLWKLVSYANSEGELASVLPDHEITVEFEGGRVAGNAGCNNYFGAYDVSGDRLTLGPIGATVMACEDAVNKQEGEYLGALENAVSYEVMSDRLQITNPEGKTVLTFVRVEPMPLMGTIWQLRFHNRGKEALVSALVGTEITAVFGADGSLTGSGGCNSYTASYQVEGDAITIGPPATTRMMCAEPEGIMEQESAYMAALESATAYQIEGDKLWMTNAEGVQVAIFTAAEE
jgi:heat shock protein HslJ